MLSEADNALRDLFAGLALNVISGKGLSATYEVGPCNAAVAERAYAIADAMMTERAKTSGD